jgi:hypothetical protein
VRWWLAAALCLTTVGAHAQLAGSERTHFIAKVRAACERSAASNPILAGASHRSLAYLCACGARNVADSADFSQLSVRPQEIMRDALAQCLAARGGFVPGQTITPNRWAASGRRLDA